MTTKTSSYARLKEENEQLKKMLDNIQSAIEGTLPSIGRMVASKGTVSCDVEGEENRETLTFYQDPEDVCRVFPYWLIIHTPGGRWKIHAGVVQAEFEPGQTRQIFVKGERNAVDVEFVPSSNVAVDDPGSYS